MAGMLAGLMALRDFRTARREVEDLQRQKGELLHVLRLAAEVEDRARLDSAERVGLTVAINEAERDLKLLEAGVVARRGPRKVITIAGTLGCLLVGVFLLWRSLGPAPGGEAPPQDVLLPDVQLVDVEVGGRTARAAISLDALNQIPTTGGVRFLAANGQVLATWRSADGAMQRRRVDATLVTRPHDWAAWCATDSVASTECLVVGEPGVGGDGGPRDADGGPADHDGGPDAGGPVLSDAQRCRDGGNLLCFQVALQREEQGEFNTARALYEIACERGGSQACQRLGWLYSTGRERVPADPQKAAEYYSLACRGHHASACFSLGLMLLNGRSVPQDSAQAAAVFKIACSGGQANACDALGIMYQRGRGVPRDNQRARELHQRACGENDPSGCANLAFLLASGRGGERDDRKAGDLYARACGRGNAVGCNSLAFMVAAGRSTRDLLGTPQELRRRACDLGLADACREPLH